MKVLIQRVLSAAVEIDGVIHSQIEQGLLLYVCFESNDSKATIDKSVKKLISLRIFEDDNGKMNRNILQTKHSIMSISQFTLSWNGSGGNRPSFENSMKPDQACSFYDLFNSELSDNIDHVKTGKFGADTKVCSNNDGPVTIFLSF
jgi:D-tyrosyl-tRNA(Tyr) deacylase